MADPHSPLAEGVCLTCCDFDVQVADFGFRQCGIVVSLETEGNGFDDLPFGIVSRTGAAHDPKARNPEAPIAALGIVSIFDTKFHNHLPSYKSLRGGANRVAGFVPNHRA